MANSIDNPEFKNSNDTVAALYHDPDDAERAIQRLSEAGVPKSNIGVAVSNGREHHKGGKNFIEKLESMFKPNEREEYDSNNADDVLGNMGLRASK